MPLLGSVNAGIYRNQDVIPWPGQETAQSGRSGPPRADTPLMRLGIEQQKEQAINAIFQKHGEDYDGAVAEVMNIDPETGQKLAGLIADGRKKGAEQHKAETESSLKNLEMVGHGIELAIQDPTQYPKLLDFVAKQPGGSQYLQFAPKPDDPDLVPKLKALLPAVLGPKDFLKVTADAAQDYIDGDKQLAAAKTLAAAVTPEQRQIADKWLKDGGLKDFSQMWPDAQTAATARDAMLEQKAKEKPSGEKTVQHVDIALPGKGNVKAVFDPNANGGKGGYFWNGQDVTAIAKQSTPASIIVQNMNAGTAAASVPGQMRTTLSGKQYIDLGDFGTPKEQAAARAAAEKAGIMAVDKQTGASLKALDTAKQNAMSIWSDIKAKLPKDAQGRITAAAGNKLSAYFQTDADLAAFGSWRTAAIQQVQALAEPGMGLRINQAEIKQAMENDIPQITDTVATAAQRIKNLMTMLNHKENDALTRNRSTLVAPSGTTKKNPFPEK